MLNRTALSHQFISIEDESFVETILPEVCVLGAVVWGIERQVKKALTHVIIPHGYLVGRLIVPRSVRPAVLR